jgi:hypothetical protein
LIKLSLRVWSEEYIRRIDESFGKELRTWIWSLTYYYFSFSIWLFIPFPEQVLLSRSSTKFLRDIVSVLVFFSFFFCIDNRLIVPYKRWKK